MGDVMPKVSVIVPVYNVEKYLESCIDCILNQTFSDFDLILVDDGSTDASSDICDEYEKKDNRIHVIHQQNGGSSNARNTGLVYALHHSTSEWITWVDSDDLINNRYIEYLLNACIIMKKEISVCGFSLNFDEVTSAKTSPEYQVGYTEFCWCDDTVETPVLWGKIYKKSLWENIRFPDGKTYDDAYTTYRVLFQVKQIVFFNSKLYFYRQADNSLMHSKWNIRRLDSIEAIEQQLLFFNENGFREAWKYTCKLYLDHLIYNLQFMKESSELHSLFLIYRRIYREFLLENGNKCGLSLKEAPGYYSITWPIFSVYIVLQRNGFTGLWQRFIKRVLGGMK